MQEFNEGDLVEAVKGETVIRGRLVTDERVCPTISGSDWGVIALESEGFTLTVIEKAAPRPWLDAKISETWRLEPHGVAYNVVGGSEKNWFTRANVYGRVENVEVTDTEITSAVMLEPASVTAKKVLDAIRQRIGSIDSAHDFQAVAASFGVTE